MAKRVLLIGDEGVVLYLSSGKNVEHECSIPWSVPDFEEQLINVFTEKNSGKSVRLVFDVVEQHYRKETLPKVSSLDKPKILKRKIDSAFSNTKIRGALELKGKKKRDKLMKVDSPDSYLLAGLPETENINKIINAIFEAGVHVSGVCLLPVESASMLQELAKKNLNSTNEMASRWIVFIGQHETGGLRQVVIKDGDLALTRLTPMAENVSSGTAWAEEVAKEFKATLSYVARFGYNPSEGLDVFVVSGAAEKEAMQSVGLPVSNFYPMTVHEAGKLIGFKYGKGVKPKYSDAVHAGWIGKKGGPSLNLKIEEISKIVLPRMAVKFGSILLLLAAIGLSYMLYSSFAEYREVHSEIAQNKTQYNLLKREYDQEAAIFAAVPVKPDVVRGSLAVKGLLVENSISPEPVLKVVRDNLGSEVFLADMSYRHVPNAKIDLPDKNGGAKKQSDVLKKIMAKMTGKGSKKLADNGYFELFFSYSLPNDMPLEEKVAETESFLKRLRGALPDHEITMEKQFGGVSRTGVFSAKIGTASDGGGSSVGGGSSAKDEEMARFKVIGVPL